MPGLARKHLEFFDHREGSEPAERSPGLLRVELVRVPVDPEAQGSIPTGHGAGAVCG